MTVGAQSGTLTYGTAGDATYTVTTTNILTGHIYTVSIAGLPTGASASDVDIELNGTIDSGTLTIHSNGSTPAGTYSLTLTIDGVTSASFDFTIDQATITNAAVDVIAPSIGGIPDTNATPAAGSHFTAGAVSWSPADNPFKSTGQYTATVTLTVSNGNYTFTGLTNATINGNTATVVNISTTGDKATLSYKFPAPTMYYTTLSLSASPSDEQTYPGDVVLTA